MKIKHSIEKSDLEVTMVEMMKESSQYVSTNIQIQM